MAPNDVSPENALPDPLISAQIYQSWLNEWLGFADSKNRDAAKECELTYAMWKENADVRAATGLPPQPFFIPKKKVVARGANGYMLLQNNSPYLVDTDEPVWAPPPPPGPKVDPGQTLTFTDASGKVHTGRVVSHGPFGTMIDWGI